MSRGNRNKNGRIDNNRVGTQRRHWGKQSVSDGEEKLNEYQMGRGGRRVIEITEDKLVKQATREEESN